MVSFFDMSAPKPCFHLSIPQFHIDTLFPHSWWSVCRGTWLYRTSMFYPVFLSRTLCVIAVNATTFRLYHVTLSCSTSSSAFTAFPLQYLIQWILLRETQRDLATIKRCTTLCTVCMPVCYPHKLTITKIPTAGLKMIAKKWKLLLVIEPCSTT
jgi:hypothetical protein